MSAPHNRYEFNTEIRFPQETASSVPALVKTVEEICARTGITLWPDALTVTFDLHVPEHLSRMDVVDEFDHLDCGIKRWDPRPTKSEVSKEAGMSEGTEPATRKCYACLATDDPHGTVPVRFLADDLCEVCGTREAAMHARQEEILRTVAAWAEHRSMEPLEAILEFREAITLRGDLMEHVMQGGTMRTWRHPDKEDAA